MKKIVVTLLILTLSCILVACGAQKSQLEMVEEKISMKDVSLSIGDNEAYRVELREVTGEVMPKLDGVVSECSHRHVLTLVPKALEGMESSIKVTLQDKDNKVDITLQKDILGLSYSASIGENILTFCPTHIDIMNGDKAVGIDLIPALKDAKVDYKQAIKISLEAMGDEVSQDFDAKEYKGEVIVKLIHNQKSPSSPYYYYISFVRNQDEFASCLVDPASGSIVNKKVR